MVTEDSFICPITKAVMVDPVVDIDGNSYERSAIEQWLNLHGTSPITRNPLCAADLFPNRALKDAIHNAYHNKPNESTLSSDDISKEEGSDSSIVITPDDVTFQVTSTVAENNDRLVRISLIPPIGIDKAPLDIICVVDVSYSMSSIASIPGEVEQSNLTILDLVKHSIKTTIKSLGPYE